MGCYSGMGGFGIDSMGIEDIICGLGNGIGGWIFCWMILWRLGIGCWEACGICRWGSTDDNNCDIWDIGICPGCITVGIPDIPGGIPCIPGGIIGIPDPCTELWLGCCAAIDAIILLTAWSSWLIIFLIWLCSLNCATGLPPIILDICAIICSFGSFGLSSFNLRISINLLVYSLVGLITS